MTTTENTSWTAELIRRRDDAQQTALDLEHYPASLWQALADLAAAALGERVDHASLVGAVEELSELIREEADHG